MHGGITVGGLAAGTPVLMAYDGIFAPMPFPLNGGTTIGVPGTGATPTTIPGAEATNMMPATGSMARLRKPQP